jgi:hypothetical protein
MCAALNDDMPLIRWHALVYYRTDDGTLMCEYDLEELADLHDRVELGPHWDTIEKIEVFRVKHVSDETLTTEEALELRGTMVKPAHRHVRRRSF